MGLATCASLRSPSSHTTSLTSSRTSILDTVVQAVSTSSTQDNMSNADGRSVGRGTPVGRGTLTLHRELALSGTRRGPDSWRHAARPSNLKLRRSLYVDCPAHLPPTSTQPPPPPRGQPRTLPAPSSAATHWRPLLAVAKLGFASGPPSLFRPLSRPVSCCVVSSAPCDSVSAPSPAPDIAASITRCTRQLHMTSTVAHKKQGYNFPALPFPLLGAGTE